MKFRNIITLLFITFTVFSSAYFMSDFQSDSQIIRSMSSYSFSDLEFSDVEEFSSLEESLILEEPLDLEEHFDSIEYCALEKATNVLVVGNLNKSQRIYEYFKYQIYRLHLISEEHFQYFYENNKNFSYYEFNKYNDLGSCYFIRYILLIDELMRSFAIKGKGIPIHLKCRLIVSFGVVKKELEEIYSLFSYGVSVR